ncbi:MAG: MBL fold metallo-hydrolase [Myxococcales bacterium]|nr:MBL fold metallo-hydrolase [Myxococcales bacterium]
MSKGTSAAKLTIIVDNKAAEGLLCEHGFSAWIEVAGRRLLFDTGQGEALAGNADKLGIDLRTADTLVLSHGHYDHTGGVPLLIARAPTAEIYAHPAAAGPRYSLRDGIAKPIAMPAAARTAIEVHPVGVRWTTRSQQLAIDLGLTGPIPRLTDFEDTGGPFFVDADGAQPDPIADDLALWMRTDRGLVVVVGCSHAGLVNTLRHALKLSGEPRLHAVLGGFHLGEASEVRLARTMVELQELGPDLIVPCHCTGDAPVERLRQSFGERVVPGSAGAVFRFGGASASTTKEWT